MQENGRQDAITALEYGPGFGFDDLRQTIKENEHMMNEFDDLDDFAGYLAKLHLK